MTGLSEAELLPVAKRSRTERSEARSLRSLSGLSWRLIDDAEHFGHVIFAADVGRWNYSAIGKTLAESCFSSWVNE